MSRLQETQALVRRDEIVDAPAIERPFAVNRNFNLPTALHAGFFGLFLAYLGVMGLGFAHPEMIIVMAICFLFTAAFYVVPMMWSVMDPDHTDRSMPLSDLLANGVETLTGRTSGAGAIAQVMVLPVLILGWGIAVVAIAATS